VMRLVLQKFMDYESYVTPCCEKTKRFWEWAFMVCPDSKFKWCFKSMTNLWLDYMVSHIEFRDSLRKWLLENEEELAEQYTKTQPTKRVTQALKNIKQRIEAENKKLFDNLYYNIPITQNFTLQDLNNQIENNGILIQLDPKIMPKNCPEERSYKLAANPDVNGFLKKFCSKLYTEEKVQYTEPIFHYEMIEADDEMEEEESNSSPDHDQIE